MVDVVVTTTTIVVPVNIFHQLELPTYISQTLFLALLNISFVVGWHSREAGYI